MLKGLFRLVGMLVVILILVTALLFYLEGKGVLTGDLGALVRTLRLLGTEAWSAITTFAHQSGIAEDAQELLSKGVDMLGEAIDPSEATPSPVPETIITPMPTATPVPYEVMISPVPQTMEPGVDYVG